jgi:hypothetical protein
MWKVWLQVESGLTFSRSESGDLFISTDSIRCVIKVNSHQQGRNHSHHILGKPKYQQAARRVGIRDPFAAIQCEAGHRKQKLLRILVLLNEMSSSRIPSSDPPSTSIPACRAFRNLELLSIRPGLRSSDWRCRLYLCIMPFLTSRNSFLHSPSPTTTSTDTHGKLLDVVDDELSSWGLDYPSPV